MRMRPAALGVPGALVALVLWFAPPQPVSAQEVVRIGFVGEMSGPFADFGMQMLSGMKVYMRQHGDTVAGKKIEIIVRDVGGPNPAVSKRLAQELVLRDKVAFLAGFGFSPNALSAADVSAQGKVPMIVMNAAAKNIPAKSPYIVRTSMTTAHTAAGTARWAVGKEIRRVFTIVNDYSPGHDAEASFIAAFKAGGGEVVGSIRAPLSTVNFGPYMERVKDARPDALFAFTAAGNTGAAFLRATKERGLAAQGIRVIGTGDIVYEPLFEVVGDTALGIVTIHPYSAAHDSPENESFVKAFLDLSEGALPTIMAVGGYDGMAVIYEILRRLDGKVDPDRAMEVARGLKLTSPRGPITIDSATRDIVQGLYARRVERRHGRLMNVEFEKAEEPSFR